MGATKKTTNGHEHDSLGLLANGSSGAWDFSVDETISGKHRWFAQLEGPNVTLSFEISSPRLVGEVIDFLRDSSKSGRLKVGCDRQIPVSLVKDDEFSDRIFWIVGTESQPVARFTILAAEISDVVAAMGQAQEDLDS